MKNHPQRRWCAQQQSGERVREHEQLHTYGRLCGSEWRAWQGFTDWAATQGTIITHD